MAFNRLVADPSMIDLLDLLKKDILLNTNCHAIGKIQEFNSTDQTCKVSINYSKTFYRKNEKNGIYYNPQVDEGLYTTFKEDYPVLSECPMIIMSGGVGGITFPIAVGDDCLLLFNDRDMDNWFEGLNKGSVNSERLHSFADGIALVGLRSLKKSISSYDAVNTVLFHGDNKITLKTNEIVIEKGTTIITLGTKIKIENALGDTLNDVLQELIINVNAILTTNTIPGSPAAIGAASQAALVATGIKIAGLLE